MLAIAKATAHNMEDFIQDIRSELEKGAVIPQIQQTAKNSVKENWRNSNFMLLCSGYV